MQATIISARGYPQSAHGYMNYDAGYPASRVDQELALAGLTL